MDATSSPFEIRVSCSHLACRRVHVALFVKPPGKEWVLFGTTETLDSSNGSPAFTHSFRVPFVFHELQHLRFDVMEEESRLVGSAEMTMADLAGVNKLTKELKQRGVAVAAAYLHIFPEEAMASSDNFFARLHLSASGLDKKDLFGKADPFFVISRQVMTRVFISERFDLI